MWPATKISPPRPAALVTRARLVTALNNVVDSGQVMFVMAPGGSGKTMLLTDWTRQASVPVAWYAIDIADRDTRRLMAGICASVERMVPGTTAGALASLENGDPEVAAVNALFAALADRQLALVLDDFHHLANLPAALTLLDHILYLRPPSLTPIILSRSVPPFGFAAHAAFDKIAGIGREDLQFDADEAMDLLSAHGLETGAVAPLVRRSGGWAAGLLLLARTAPTGPLLLRARGDALMEHLGDEIVAALPENMRDFLLHSAALGQATAEQADAILRRNDSARLYADIAARGLFLDQAENIYRYHDLFAEYLVGALKATRSALLFEIRRSAATWWATRGDVARGLGLLAQIEDWEGLAAMLERERRELWERGLGSSILAYVEILPPEYHTPPLLVLSGYARIQRAEYAEALDLADKGMAAAGDDKEWLSASLLRVQALVYAVRDDEAIRSADAALAVAQGVGQERAVNYLREMRGTAHLRRGHPFDGRADLAVALAFQEREGDEAGQARVLFNWATQLIGVGQTRDAADLLQRARALCHALPETAPMVANIHNSHALLCLLTGELDVAREQAEKACDLARGRHPYIECWAMSTLARVCLDIGDLAATERLSGEAEALAERLDSTDTLNDVLRTRIAIALWRRDRNGARRLLDDAEPLAATPADKALLVFLDGLLALRSNAPARAAQLLERAHVALSDLNYPHYAARSCLLRAEALLAMGAVRDVEETLNRLVDLVIPPSAEEYLRPITRFARRVFAQHRTLRRLRRDTRDLLERLSGDPKAKVALHVLSSLLPDPSASSLAMPVLSLSPFGQGCLRLDGDEIDVLVFPPKARELLFWAAHIGRPVKRAEILTALWDDEASLALFWDAGRHLRRVLGADAWGPTGGAYVLRCAIDDASRRFDGACEAALGAASPAERLAAAERALALYGDGGYLEWCDSFWCTIEREHVARQALQVVSTLIELYRQSNLIEDAIAVARAAIARDPTEEFLCAALMQLLLDAGKAEDAVEEYHRYRSRLLDDYEAEPSDGVLRLAEAAVASLQARSDIARFSATTG